MTETLSIARRIQASHPLILAGVQRIITAAALAAEQIQNETTGYDFAVAVEGVLDNFTAAEFAPKGTVADSQPRPESDDTRPLFERLNDEKPGLVRAIQRLASLLQEAVDFITDEQLALDYHEQVTGPFYKALGLANDDELSDEEAQAFIALMEQLLADESEAKAEPGE